MEPTEARSSSRIREELAIYGGPAIRDRAWPLWPRADKRTDELILEILHSGRWAISGLYNGEKLYERRFAEEFAAYNKVRYCVPTVNGSAALTIALEALNIGYGKEVLVPGLTWVSCASAVAQVGAIPVLIDIDPANLCMSLEAAQNAITENTAAMLIVHLYCSLADIDGFLQLSQKTGIPLLEDASQAHGAIWDEHHVGTFGKIGIFSMQDSKVLTCGEGGAAITDDPQLYYVMQQLRADGRTYAHEPRLHRVELEAVGTMQGRNFCLSEFHSAILLDRLQHLDDENEQRRRNAEYLGDLLTEIGDITLMKQFTHANAVTYYQFCVRLNREAFGHAAIETICDALTAELGILIKPLGKPLNANILYNPLLLSRISPDLRTSPKLNPKNYSLPNATRAVQECLTIPHQVLLGAKEDIEDIAVAFAKVKHQSYRFQQAC